MQMSPIVIEKHKLRIIVKHTFLLKIIVCFFMASKQQPTKFEIDK